MEALTLFFEVRPHIALKFIKISVKNVNLKDILKPILPISLFLGFVISQEAKNHKAKLSHAALSVIVSFLENFFIS